MKFVALYTDLNRRHLVWLTRRRVCFDRNWLVEHQLVMPILWRHVSIFNIKVPVFDQWHHSVGLNLKDVIFRVSDWVTIYPGQALTSWRKNVTVNRKPDNILLVLSHVSRSTVTTKLTFSVWQTCTKTNIVSHRNGCKIILTGVIPFVEITPSSWPISMKTFLL